VQTIGNHQLFDGSFQQLVQHGIAAADRSPAIRSGFEQILDETHFVVAFSVVRYIDSGADKLGIALEHFAWNASSHPMLHVVRHQMQEAVERLIRPGNDKPGERLTPVNLTQLLDDGAEVLIDDMIAVALEIGLGPSALLVMARDQTLQ
jgi:hypothetical protein